MTGRVGGLPLGLATAGGRRGGSLVLLSSVAVGLDGGELDITERALTVEDECQGLRLGDGQMRGVVALPDTRLGQMTDDAALTFDVVQAVEEALGGLHELAVVDLPVGPGHDHPGHTALARRAGIEDGGGCGHGHSLGEVFQGPCEEFLRAGPVSVEVELVYRDHPVGLRTIRGTQGPILELAVVRLVVGSAVEGEEVIGEVVSETELGVLCVVIGVPRQGHRGGPEQADQDDKNHRRLRHLQHKFSLQRPAAQTQSTLTTESGQSGTRKSYITCIMYPSAGTHKCCQLKGSLQHFGEFLGW